MAIAGIESRTRGRNYAVFEFFHDTRAACSKAVIITVSRDSLNSITRNQRDTVVIFEGHYRVREQAWQEHVRFGGNGP